MSMKTILVPMENHDAMQSALDTALLLGRRCNSYIEGFTLRWSINEFIVGDVMAGAPLETYREDIAEEAKKAKQIFESFMQKHDVPRAAETTESLSFGWLDDASEGESFIGSYGRIYSSHDRSGYGVEFRETFQNMAGVCSLYAETAVSLGRLGHDPWTRDDRRRFKQRRCVCYP